MPQHLTAPSLLAADLSRLAEEIAVVNETAEADWLHYDVMDGQFVPNMSFGLPLLGAVRKLCTKPIDVHLMMERPERHLGAYRAAGADHLTVHYETCPNLHGTLQQIRGLGASAGVAINPATTVDLLDDVLDELDIALVMSVNPGFGGQKFIYRTLRKVERLRERLTTRNLPARVVVDGGVGLQNAQQLLQAGAHVLVAGSAVFGADDPAEAIRRLKNTGHEVAKFA